jgi:hypothetical protein
MNVYLILATAMVLLIAFAFSLDHEPRLVICDEQEYQKCVWISKQFDMQQNKGFDYDEE